MMLHYSALFSVVAMVCALSAFGSMSHVSAGFAWLLAGAFALIGFATLAFDRVE
jgi:hypothetical protein